MSDVKSAGAAAARTREEQDARSDSEGHANQVRPHIRDLAADYARVAQALRDVRHLLPPEGVAMVDAALGHAAFEDLASLVDSGFQMGRSTPLN